jgi:hypothetical protein
VRLDAVQVVGDAAFTAGRPGSRPSARPSDAVDVLVRYAPTANGTVAAALHLAASDR